MKNLIIGLVLIAFSTVSKSDFNQAVKNYESGNYKEALAEFQSLAEIGNKSAQYNLGFMYLDGLGTKQDLAKAYAWIKLSDEDGESTETKDVLKQIEKHLKGARKELADSKFAEISGLFGRQAIIDELQPVFDKSSKSKLVGAIPIKTIPASYPISAQRAGIEGYVKVTFQLNELGSPIEIDVTDSFPSGVFDSVTLNAIKKWQFELAGADKNKEYRYTMEYKLSGGSFNTKTRNLVREFKESAKAGDPVGQYYYAKYGEMVLKDEVDDTELYYNSAVQGIADAQHELGLKLLSGDGCQQDRKKGIKWLTSAASANLGRAQLKLSRLFSQVEGADAKEKSNFWLEKAYKSNDIEAALSTAARLSNSPDYTPLQVIEKLNILDEKSVVDPLKYYQLYADSYAKANDFNNAYKYQNKANKMLRRYGKVPKDMREKLSEYKNKRES